MVLDVLKPHQPSILELAKSIAGLKHVTGVDCSLQEVDTQTESIKITIEGVNINFDEVQQVIEDMGAVIHSIDRVAAGIKLIEEAETPQDRLA